MSAADACLRGRHTPDGGRSPSDQFVPFRRRLATVALAVGATSAFADHGSRHGHHHGDRVLKAGLFGSQIDAPPLFDVNPGGAPWVIDKGAAKVRRDSRVKVRIRGLVIPTAPQNGTNPLSNIAATVYCGGEAVGTTSAAAFSTGGDARIDEKLDKKLPEPCLVPAVLMNPAPGGAINTDVYIAATGE
jgi:hypothetical protein